MTRLIMILTACYAGLLGASEALVSYPVVDTGQDRCFDTDRQIDPPAPGQAFAGQDAQFAGLQPRYRDNGDGTVSDLVTGLMWSQATPATKTTLPAAQTAATALRLGGHDDWRVPTIKELYSLIDFRGATGSPSRLAGPPSDAIPFIDTDVFGFRYGDTAAGERSIDAQWLSCTRYVGTTMGGNATVFGVNFADGRIKGYPDSSHGGPPKTFYVRFVRGGPYGINDFVDNGDGTITDRATGLQWMQTDSVAAMDWQEALAYADGLSLAGHSDWRLPNAKELQSIVDYSRSPDTSASPAIDPCFTCTPITNEAGQPDFGWYWTSTTHHDGPNPARGAVYLAFGRAIGQLTRIGIVDVHGAGAQRSDPKTGDAQLGHGPQGDARRVRNLVRCVRGGTASPVTTAAVRDPDRYPATVTIAGDASPAAAPASASPFVDRLDRDGDGRVSRSEFDGPANAFDHLDRNHDGFLSEDEAPHRSRRQ